MKNVLGILLLMNVVHLSACQAEEQSVLELLAGRLSPAQAEIKNHKALEKKIQESDEKIADLQRLNMADLQCLKIANIQRLLNEEKEKDDEINKIKERIAALEKSEKEGWV